MFVSCTDEKTKTTVIDNFTKQSPLRIVICTVAFGMGIDCRDVSYIYHLGSPDDIESYIQETGRAGRNGDIAYCTLLKTKDWKCYVTDDCMIDYLENKQICRREILFSSMEGHQRLEKNKKQCLCCDICQETCRCVNCSSSVI